jgi:hypothetical protein
VGLGVGFRVPNRKWDCTVNVKSGAWEKLDKL